MPSRITTDPDWQYFADNLQRTSHGQRYLKRWKLTQSALISLINARDAGNAPAVEKCRRAYIQLSDRCNDALDELERIYGWPTP